MYEKKVILTWWGSISNGGETAGDLISLLVIIETLISKGIQFRVLSKRSYSEINRYVISEDSIDINGFNTFIFVCGPLIKDSIELNNLIHKFIKLKKIAIGVSVLDRSWNIFDYVFSREDDNLFFDLSVLYNHKGIIEKQKSQYALCLRGKQREYGMERCHSTVVEDYIKTIKKINFENIDTRLDKKKLDYKNVYESIASKSMIITTRFHGCMFSVHSAVPFVAIDQIEDNGKIFNFFTQLGWEYTYRYNSIDSKKVQNLIYELNENPNKYNDELLRIKATLYTNAQVVLNKMLQLL